MLIRQIREAIAEENRKEIIERLKKGREERIRKGRMAGGTLPYGYRREGTEIRQEPKEAEIVRLIFALKEENMSYDEIAAILNERGYHRRNRTAWTRRQVRAILGREEVYKQGIIKYGAVRGKNADLILI